MPRAAVLNLDPVDILDQITLCCRGAPGHHRTFSGLPGICRYMPGVPLPQHGWLINVWHSQMSFRGREWGTRLPFVENHYTNSAFPFSSAIWVSPRDYTVPEGMYHLRYAHYMNVKEKEESRVRGMGLWWQKEGRVLALPSQLMHSRWFYFIYH